MRYVVAQTSGNFHIMERRNVGEAEVYVTIAEAYTAEGAGHIADVLNRDERTRPQSG